MANYPLMPVAGINHVAEDAAMRVRAEQWGWRNWVRDALNVDITPQGKIDLRAAARRVCATPYANLWQSTLHGDVFGTLAGQWVRIDPATWTHEALATCGDGAAYHEALGGRVLVAGAEGIFAYDGHTAQRLTLATPGAPLLVARQGALPAGAYGAAVAWLRGALESGLSAMTSITLPEAGAIGLTLPLALDADITGARVYLTRPNGGELTRLGDFAPDATIDIPVLPAPGAGASFRFLSPMPTGLYLKYWRGRLLTARGSVLRFSEPMTYHLHDERHGFIQMPQRITFVQPLDGGIWVGQVDHVVFLKGNAPGELVFDHKDAAPPVPGSCTAMDADAARPLLDDDAEGGAALWLAANGFVAGSATGQLKEPSAGVLSGIAGQSGSTALKGRRALAVVN